MSDPDPAVVAAKNDLRGRLVAQRRARTADERLAAALANASHLLNLLTGAGTVCGYLPLDSEPLRTDLLDCLVAAGSTVLVPVATPDAPLDWCRYPGPSSPGAYGIAEPTGRRLGPDAVTSADAVLVPALAVDHAGARLGRGGGHYDRTLALLGDRSPDLIAVLFDEELLASVPTDPHDRPVTSGVMPTTGSVHFPR